MPDTGRSAFDRRDFGAAAALWRGEAAAGSAEAKFGLGLLNDLGFGTPRNAAKALRWYIEAASDGLPEAKFNVGVMMDAGAGVPRDTIAAAVWYARAAANGHHRGEYNLGLLYQGGEGVPRNPDLARYWLDRAAGSLPAAAERREALAPAAPEDRRLAPPELGTAALVPAKNASRAELVWSAPPPPLGSHYLVEVVRLPEGTETWGSLLLGRSTEASALVTPLPDTRARHAWRVRLIDPKTSRYAASPWLALEEETGHARGVPVGRVTLHIGAEDASAQWLADELAPSFQAASLWVRIEKDSSSATESGVRYAFAQDADLAASIAEFLPVLAADAATLAPDPKAAPGEIDVRLVGGPSKPAPAELRISATGSPRLTPSEVVENVD